MAVVKGIQRIPLVGLAGELVEGYLPLVDDYFYCMSFDRYSGRAADNADTSS